MRDIIVSSLPTQHGIPVRPKSPVSIEKEEEDM